MRLAHAFCAGALFTALATPIGASGPSVDIPTRARGAQRIVVATVADVQSFLTKNNYGDQVIVSRLFLEVEETLKGVPQSALWLDIEGGTIGALTMRVSDMPVVARGDRAVFFTNPQGSGGNTSHLRGLGILKLTKEDRVEELNLTLDDVRRSVQVAR